MINEFLKKVFKIKKEDYVEIDNVKYKNIYWIRNFIKGIDYYFLICLKEDFYIFREVII